MLEIYEKSQFSRVCTKGAVSGYWKLRQFARMRKVTVFICFLEML